MMKGKKDVNKSLKHCKVCQENFGERFSFCPVCGEPLSAIETGQPEAFAVAAPNADFKAEEIAPSAVVTAPLNQEVLGKFTQPSETTNGSAHRQTAQEAVSVAPRAAKENGGNRQTATTRPASQNLRDDGLYHLTIIETPKGYTRYLGYGAIFALFFLMTSMVVIFIYDIYNYKLDIGAVEDGMMLTSVVADEAPPVEDKEIVRKDTNKGGGGGGGGGKEEPKPASTGKMAMQVKDPIIPPSKDITPLDNPELKIQPATKGNQKPKINQDMPNYGIAQGGVDLSDGTGRGGGQGNGNGRGQGNGNGLGYGNGNGSGFGNGNGNGNGNGRGDGDGAPPSLPPRAPAAPVVEKLQILSKPQPRYTEEARKNAISGRVVLRVTFSANGQVTNISTVSGLPYGLTDQAIAAARQIQFIPQKQNGQPVSVSRSIEFSFNLY
jgi:TonB family protein